MRETTSERGCCVSKRDNACDRERGGGLGGERTSERERVKSNLRVRERERVRESRRENKIEIKDIRTERENECVRDNE